MFAKICKQNNLYKKGDRYEKVLQIILVSIITVIAMSNIFSTKPVKASEGYSLVITKKGEMYRDVCGNLYPVIIGPNGEKEVILNRYELAPLRALLKRDSREWKKQSALPKRILEKYYNLENFLTSKSFYVVLLSIYSYKQGYYKWRNKILGFGPDTIGKSGCFLTSIAMMLATYHLTINNYPVDPLNLNMWMKEHNGFVGDSICFGAVANFPGIRDVGYFNGCYDAKIAIYYGIVPIISVHHPELHFCVLVKTNGEKDASTTYIVNTYDAKHFTSSEYAPECMYYAPYDNIAELSNYYSTLARVRYNFSDPYIFRTAYPQ